MLEIITFTNESYIKAESVCELMRKLAASGLGIPITILCRKFQSFKKVKFLSV